MFVDSFVNAREQEAMASADEIMNQLRGQGWKPPEVCCDAMQMRRLHPSTSLTPARGGYLAATELRSTRVHRSASRETKALGMHQRRRCRTFQVAAR